MRVLQEGFQAGKRKNINYESSHERRSRPARVQLPGGEGGKCKQQVCGWKPGQAKLPADDGQNVGNEKLREIVFCAIFSFFK